MQQRRIMQNVNQLCLHQIGKFEFKFKACEAKSWCRAHAHIYHSKRWRIRHAQLTPDNISNPLSLCLNFHKVPQQPLSALAANQHSRAQLTPRALSAPTKPAAAKRGTQKVLRRALFLRLFLLRGIKI
jgi:hypothetical protein